MIILFIAFVALAFWYFLLGPLIESFSLDWLLYPRIDAVLIAAVAFLHRAEEGWCGNQRGINRDVFKNGVGVRWPVTDRHNRLLHQGFIFWLIWFSCACALVGNDGWFLLLPLGIFAADFVQHALFCTVARGYVGGWWTAVAYGAVVLMLFHASWAGLNLFGLHSGIGFLLIFGNLGMLWLRNKRKPRVP